MALARYGDGSGAAVGALASQVHPVFMLPPVAAAWFGSLLAGRFSVAVGALHAAAIFFAVYTAHVKDGYVDFYVRGEDDDHPLTERGCRAALVGSTLCFGACLVALWLVVDVWAALLTLPGWVVGYLHAPHLDTRPVTATAGYPFGVALAILGGAYVQTGTLPFRAVAFAGVFLVLLSGVKVVDDAQDYDYDRTIAKRTVAVALGTRRAHRVAYALVALALLGVLALAGLGVFPRGSAVAVVAFAAVAAVASRADADVATMLLVRGSYVFLACLVAAVWYRPLG